MIHRVELADGWHLLRVEVGTHHEWIICDPNGDHLGGTEKHLDEFDEAMMRIHGFTDIDKAMHRIWSEWFQYYKRHFRGPGIAISMADQQAFFEIAQPIMRNLVNVGQSTSR